MRVLIRILVVEMILVRQIRGVVLGREDGSLGVRCSIVKVQAEVRLWSDGVLHSWFGALAWTIIGMQGSRFVLE